MNWDTVEGTWKQLRGRVRQKWGELTDDDLTTFGGNSDQLSGLLQQRYGYARDRAEREINEFSNEPKR